MKHVVRRRAVRETEQKRSVGKGEKKEQERKNTTRRKCREELRNK